MIVENLFTVDEAAAILKQDAATVYRWLAIGKLRGSRRGKRGSWEIPASELQYWASEKLSGSEKALLDMVSHVWSMQQQSADPDPRTYQEALTEMLQYLELQFESVRFSNAASHTRGRLNQTKEEANPAGETTLASLQELIALRHCGKLSDEELREILVERDWVEMYERLTNEIVLVHEEEYGLTGQ